MTYKLEYPGGVLWSATTGVVSSFAGTTIILASSDLSLPDSYQMKLIGSFTYNPAYTVEVDFTINIDKCFLTSISTSVETPITYYLRTRALVTPLTPFTSSISCGSFVYSISTSQTTAAITIDPSTMELRVTTSSPMDLGTNVVTIVGTLYQPGTGTIYKWASTTVAVTIIERCYSTVITPAVQGDFYYDVSPLSKTF